jgi:plasmid stabilization system protein ParE
MKVVYTAAALRDLDEIAEWLAVKLSDDRSHG